MRKRARKRVTLSKTVAIQRLDKILPLVEENVLIATNVEAALEEANTIVQSMSKKTFFGANCYNVVRQSMVLDLTITLARLFDSGRRWSKRNKSDVAGIPLLVHFLKQKRCQSVLLERARNWIPGSFRSEQNVRDCEHAIVQAIESYHSLVRSPGGRRALGSLKNFRNVKLAHTLMDKLLEELPKYDDLFQMVDVARHFTTLAKLAITGVNTDFVEIEKIRRHEAEFFWSNALKAVVAADGKMNQ